VGGAHKGARARGHATWPGFSACVRAGPRRFAGKAELTGRPHGRARGDRRTEGTTHCADGAGSQDRERMQARGRRQPTPTYQPHQVEGWGESVWAKELALTGGAHLSGGAGMCTTSLGWTGQSWASWPLGWDVLAQVLIELIV
jgi:hypothetical protein